MLVLDLIMALGLRPQEACQLHVRNVKSDGGGLYLDVTTVLDDVDDGEEIDPAWKARLTEVPKRSDSESDAEWEARARLKTGNSTRKIPVPAGLADAILAQRDTVISDKSGLLFPSFVGVANLAKSIGNDVSEHIKSKCSFADNRRLVLYSARHRFRDLCVRCKITKEVSEALMGHRDENPIAERYGDKNKWADVKREAIELVFPLVFRDPAASDQTETRDAA